MLLDRMLRVPNTEAMGQGREGSVTLEFELDWVVVKRTVGFHLRELEERVGRSRDRAGERTREGESKGREK